jgi:predicted N-acetyltransferase YhbS
LGAVRELVFTAFGPVEGPVIAQLISNLLLDPSAAPCLSLVATIDRDIVGHVLFTHAEVRQPGRVVAAAILAPLAVHPTVQSKGIGGQLIMAGLESMADRRVELVFVLGHPDYYPRYGFQPAGVLGFEAPHPIPIEHANAWMVQAFRPDIVGAVSGAVSCAAALRDPQYWRD